MALRGIPGGEGRPRFQFKPSRNMLILIGVLVLLIIAVVVLYFVLQGTAGGGGQVAQGTTTARGVAAAQVTSPPGAPSAVPATRPGAPTSLPATQAPAPPEVPARVTAVPTPVPLPPQGGRGVAEVSPTTAGVGGGEQALPHTASGISVWWIVPVGVLLLAVVAWWRWRRSRPTD